MRNFETSVFCPPWQRRPRSCRGEARQPHMTPSLAWGSSSQVGGGDVGWLFFLISCLFRPAPRRHGWNRRTVLLEHGCRGGGAGPFPRMGAAPPSALLSALSLSLSLSLLSITSSLPSVLTASIAISSARDVSLPSSPSSSSSSSP